MKILTATEFEKRKFKFLHQHGDWECETSPMDSDGMYTKWYTCEDRAR